jgi:hypothetical protein
MKIMENSELSQEELSEYVDLEDRFREGFSIEDQMERLGRFGKDSREISRNVRKILESDEKLMKDYENQKRALEMLREVILNSDDGRILESIRARKKFYIEVAHLGEFGRDLENYMIEKAVSEVDLRTFRFDEEFESYMRDSKACKDLYESMVREAGESQDFREKK